MLAPNTDLTKELLTDFLWSWSTITRAAITARYTQLYAPSDPAPAWFPALKTTMDALDTSSDDWITRNGSEVYGKLPQVLIDFGNLFVATANNVAGASKAEILEMIDNLVAMAQDGKTTTAACEKSMKDYVTMFTTKKSAVHDAEKSARQTLNEDESVAAAIAARINQILVSIGVDDQAARDAFSNAASSAVSIVVGVMYFSIASALALGPASPLVSLVVTTIGLTYSAATAAAKEQEIIDALKEINKLQNELTIEQQQIYALNAIINSLSYVESTLSDATLSVGIGPIWEEIIVELGNFRNQVALNVVPTTLTEVATLTVSRDRWQTIVTMATNIQKTISTSTVASPLEIKAGS